MLGMDPNAVCEFEFAGGKFRSRYLTVRQCLELRRRLKEAAQTGSDEEAIAAYLAISQIGELRAVAGELLDLTMNELLGLLYAWPHLVSALEADLKKASASPAASAPEPSAPAAAAASA